MRMSLHLNWSVAVDLWAAFVVLLHPPATVDECKARQGDKKAADDSEDPPNPPGLFDVPIENRHLELKVWA